MQGEKKNIKQEQDGEKRDRDSIIKERSTEQDWKRIFDFEVHEMSIPTSHSLLFI